MIKRLFSYVSIVLTVAIIFTAIFWFYFSSDSQRDSGAVSPLPDFLTLSKNSQVRLLDLWFPAMAQTNGQGLNPSQLTAKSVLIYDLATNNAVFEKKGLRIIHDNEIKVFSYEP